MLNVLMFMGGDYRDVLLELSKTIKEKHHPRITMLCKTKQDKQFYEANSPADKIIVIQKKKGYNAKDFEEEYRTKIHHLLINDRYYFTGCPYFPIATKPYSDAVAEVCGKFMFYEYFLEHETFDLVINPDQIADLVLKQMDIPKRILNSALHKDYLFWFDSFDRRSRLFDIGMEELWDEKEDVSDSAQIGYLKTSKTVEGNASIFKALKQTSQFIARDLYYRARRYEKVTKGNFNGWKWAAYIIRQHRQLKELHKTATVRMEDLANKRFVYYPLTGEPEITLSFCSPGYMDQLSIIQSVAVALPVNVFLVVKEHFLAVGGRPGGFYRTIKRMPNVLFVDPREKGIDVLDRAMAVVTIGSSTGMEAIQRGIPVLTYGANNFWDVVPHVQRIRSWYDLSNSLKWAISERKDKFVKYGNRLTHVITKYGFPAKDKERALSTLEKSLKIL